MAINENVDVQILHTASAASMEELEKLNSALRRSNNDLLQYAHVASHDLQEPLRKIQIFSSILDESTTMSSSDHEVVKKILAASNRMSALITDLLAHSKVVDSGKMVRPVNLNEIASNVIDDFELAIQETGAIVSTDNLPVVTGRALEMNQLFYHLIDNAFKFSDPSRIPVISIRCKKLEPAEIKGHITNPKEGKNYYDISFKDNGMGFHVKYEEQIYKVFKKLHPKDMYPGSGIGLSLCRSIVANHEGVLFVESNPGEGSEFHIIIPE